MFLNEDVVKYGIKTEVECIFDYNVSDYLIDMENNNDALNKYIENFKTNRLFYFLL